MKNILTATVLFATFVLTGCVPQTNFSHSVRTGTSFGMCMGYCTKEWTFTKAMTTAKQTSRTPNTHPDKMASTPTPQELWSKIASSIDMAALQKLPETIGCPDCADGGAEWIEVLDGTETKKVTFEYGHDVPEIHDLLVAVRAARESLEKGLFPDE